MPSGTQSTVAVLCPSPIGNTDANGHLELEAITDTEDLFSDDDQHVRGKSPMKSKVSLLPPSSDQAALTDTEDMDLSGEEDELVPEKKDLPMLEDLGLLPEPSKDIINLTEGYVRNESPMMSDTEVDIKSVEGRHKRNVLKSDTIGLGPPEPDVTQALTDVEDVEDSGDEIVHPGEDIETTLPAHYDDLGKDVKNTESVAAKPMQKTRILVSKIDQVDSSEDEGREKVHRKPRRKSGGMLGVTQQEGGTTDIEELSMTENPTPEPPRVRRKRVVKKTSVPKEKSTLAVSGDRSDGTTDVEYLSGEDGKKEVGADDGLFVPKRDEGAITDTEDVDVSDEEAEGIIPHPVSKKEPFVIPEVHNQRIKIREAAPEKEEEGEKTDEEGFELEEKEDSKPLIRRQVTLDMPAEIVSTEALEVEEAVEQALTDVEDMDVDDKEEAAILNEIASNEPKDDALNATLAEMESNIGRVSKKEKIKDQHEELKKIAKEAEMAGLTLQEILQEGGETDVEDLDDSEGEEKPVKQPKKKQVVQRDDGTDVESLEGSSSESEDEEKPVVKTSQRRKKAKRSLQRGLVPQISEVRFVDTATGPLSIIVTPGSFDQSSDMPKDNVPGVVFLETHEGIEDAGATDIEELSGDERPAIVTKLPEVEGPQTDVEELEGDESEIGETVRPLTPLPPDFEYTVLPSPKRELIHIKEDKHGVPQVTITKMPDDMLHAPQSDEQALTDTEDVYVSEEEAMRIHGAHLQEDSGYELPDFENTEIVASANKVRTSGLKVAEAEESGNTDVEELAMDSKPKRKVKPRAKLRVEEVEGNLTDVETLSDIEAGPRLKVRVDTPGGLTDTELFDTSDAEELEVPDITGRDLARTPDIIREATVHKIITVKEGVDGDTRIEEELIAPSPGEQMLTVEKDFGGVTDEEDFAASGPEDVDEPAVHEEVPLPENETTEVQISQKTQVKPIQGEERQIKDNLLLPEENTDAHTDIESLDGEGGNRCASNLEVASSFLSSALPLTVVSRNNNFVETSVRSTLSTPSPTQTVASSDPKLSLETKPFCGELTTPIVVEAELEQVYIHTPQQRPEFNEEEVVTSDGRVVRRRRLVASSCEGREVRRFWSMDEPLHDSQISRLAWLRKDYKTILYLEQPNLLDTISISDTLCETSSNYRRRLLTEFDSSSTDSFDEWCSLIGSDGMVTVVERLSRGDGTTMSSFDDLPSPNLSSIGNSSLCRSEPTFRSFSSSDSLAQRWESLSSLSRGDSGARFSEMTDDQGNAESSIAGVERETEDSGVSGANEEGIPVEENGMTVSFPTSEISYEADTTNFTGGRTISGSYDLASDTDHRDESSSYGYLCTSSVYSMESEGHYDPESIAASEQQQERGDESEESRQVCEDSGVHGSMATSMTGDLVESNEYASDRVIGDEVSVADSALSCDEKQASLAECPYETDLSEGELVDDLADGGSPERKAEEYMAARHGLSFREKLERFINRKGRLRDHTKRTESPLVGDEIDPLSSQEQDGQGPLHSDVIDVEEMSIGKETNSTGNTEVLSEGTSRGLEVREGGQGHNEDVISSSATDQEGLSYKGEYSTVCGWMGSERGAVEVGESSKMEVSAAGDSIDTSSSDEPHAVHDVLSDVSNAEEGFVESCEATEADISDALGDMSDTYGDVSVDVVDVEIYQGGVDESGTRAISTGVSAEYSGISDQGGVKPGSKMEETEGSCVKSVKSTEVEESNVEKPNDDDDDDDDEGENGYEYVVVTAKPARVIPNHESNTLPRTNKKQRKKVFTNQVKNSVDSSPKEARGRELVKMDSLGGFETASLGDSLYSSDRIKVRGLISQWEELVEEHARRSLPNSPHIGHRLITPMFPAPRKAESLRIFSDTGWNETKKSEVELVWIRQQVEEEEQASVVEIVERFEQRLVKDSGEKFLGRLKPHPQIRTPSPRSTKRRVATVKPMLESSTNSIPSDLNDEHHLVSPERDQVDVSVVAGFSTTSSSRRLLPEQVRLEVDKEETQTVGKAGSILPKVSSDDEDDDNGNGDGDGNSSSSNSSRTPRILDSMTVMKKSDGTFEDEQLGEEGQEEERHEESSRRTSVDEQLPSICHEVSPGVPKPEGAEWRLYCFLGPLLVLPGCTGMIRRGGRPLFLEKVAQNHRNAQLE